MLHQEILNTTKIIIGATTTSIIAANESREYIAFINDSDEAIYLSFGKSAILNEGIRLNPNGGTYEMYNENLYRGAVNGICGTGNKNLCLMEGY